MSDDTRKDIHNSGIPVICRACEARHKGICGALTSEQLLKLSKFTDRNVISPGTVITAVDTETERFSNVLQGVVKLSSLTPDGRQQIVGLQFAPDFLGRPFGKRSAVDVEAATQVHLCSFPKKVLEGIISESSELEHRLHEQALNQLDDARDWMLALGRKNAAEKIAFFLHWVAMHSDPERENNEELYLKLPLKRAAIADFLGLTIETVSRQFTKLRKDGLIDIVDRNTIIIHALEKLASRANL